MIKISRWRSCLNTPPKKDGHYLVVRFWDGELCYAADLDYTVEYGWNTNKLGHDCPIVFHKNRKYDRYVFWTEMTYQKEHTQNKRNSKKRGD